MPRPRTGSVYWHVDHWDIRITLPDGKRGKPQCQPADMSESRARDKAKHLTEKAVELGGVRAGKPSEPEGETLSDWAERWFEERRKSDLASVDDDEQRFESHIGRVLGHLPVAAITRDDVRRLVTYLDDRVRDHSVKFAWKTAKNVWTLARTMFKATCSSKRPDLVVREDDPTNTVQGPDCGERLDRTYLYPSEFRKLIECKDVPVQRRRLYVLAAYTLSRAGELRELRWDAVDTDRGVVAFRQATDHRNRGVKRTKSGKTRRVPIEPTLLPLLEAMREEATGARVAHVPISKLAINLQRDLKTAGLTRAELFPPPNDPGVEAGWDALTFHDLRGTGVTWMALRGDDPLVIQQRVGHADFATTQRYLREAETLGRDGGEPFPPLPPDLVPSGITSKASQVRVNIERETGFEPAETTAESSDIAQFDAPPSVTDATSSGPKSVIAGWADDSQTKQIAIAMTATRFVDACRARPDLLASLTAFAACQVLIFSVPQPSDLALN